MGNQINDRYTCSDPDCGCEIEIKQPCNKTSALENETANSSIRTTLVCFCGQEMQEAGKSVSASRAAGIN